MKEHPSNRPILVVGATGYVGGRLVPLLGVPWISGPFHGPVTGKAQLPAMGTPCSS